VEKSHLHASQGFRLHGCQGLRLHGPGKGNGKGYRRKTGRTGADKGRGSKGKTIERKGKEQAKKGKDRKQKRIEGKEEERAKKGREGKWPVRIEKGPGRQRKMAGMEREEKGPGKGMEGKMARKGRKITWGLGGGHKTM